MMAAQRDERPKGDETHRPDEKPGRAHPEGPHAQPELTTDEKTPGAGALPSLEGEEDVEAGTG